VDLSDQVFYQFNSMV